MKRAVPQSWGTSNGTFKTNKVGEITLSFVEYSLSNPRHSRVRRRSHGTFYDLIIGKQTLHDIGAVLDFKENIVNLQLKPSVTRALRHNTCQAQEPISTRNATKRVIKILDAKYDKTDPPAVVNDNCSHLTPLQQEKLLSLLLKYELLFDGTLGDWNRPPISIELKEGVKPYHGRPYPIPQIHKATLMKEINRLVGIGIMNRQSSSQWASPTFIIPKKDMTVQTITDFRELNKRIVKRPCPIPKISTTLQELEGFTYATALALTWVITPLD